MKDVERDFSLRRLGVPYGSAGEEIAECAKGLARLIEVNCPEGREKALAYTKLEECVMWANAGIAKED